MFSSATLQSLFDYRDAFPDALAQLDEWQRDAQTRRARWTLSHTPLSIGIMGQIKAGKSSFLNQLLFDGAPLLPTAATPKTANLTRIRYALQPSFTAYFYTPESWAALTRLAASPAQDSAAQVAHELVAQAQKMHGNALADWLAQGKVSLEADDIAGLLGRIDDYVGAEGRFTPLVESSEIALPLPGLEGIEIVDTPGMNDPVISRTDKTRRYMAACDVVFFLSPASRLLDDNDQRLLAEQLPAKGVKRLILVAAQFDAAILDDGYQRDSLEACEAHLRRRLGEHARRNLERLARERARQGYPEFATLLHDIGAPLFASTYAQALASLPPAQWNSGQRHLHRQFLELAEDCWDGKMPDRSDWQRIGGFAALAAALAQARAEKDAILAAQRASVEEELGKELRHFLDNLRTQASERLHILQNNELADLDARDAAQRQRIADISAALSRYLRAQADKARQQAQAMQDELRALARRAQTIEEHTGYREKCHRVEVSDAKWWNPFTWFKSHYETYYTTESYQYLMLSDAIENLRGYLDGLRMHLLKPFNTLISTATLSAGLRRELLAVMSGHSEGIDARALRAKIETALARLRWPQLTLNAADPARDLAGFADQVTDYGQRRALRARLEQIVETLQQQLMAQLEQGVRNVCGQLDHLAAGLTDTLTAAHDADRQRLRQAMADKRRQIERMQTLIATIDRCA